MNGPIIFTLSQILWAILIALLIGAIFGHWIRREAKAFLRPHLGELMAREAKARGEQVLRLWGLSNARLIGNENEGELRRADVVDDSEPPTLRLPESWTPPPQLKDRNPVA